MSSQLAAILDSSSPSGLEVGLANLGMGTPAKRFVVGYALGALAVYAFRPEIAFNGDGGAKSWVMTGDSTGGEVTTAPWWALAAIPAVVFAVFL